MTRFVSMSTKNHSGDKRGGFVPIGDVAGTLPGVVPRGRAMSAQTRHHFTTLRQVNQLIEASEAEPDLGFMARLLALCSLPRTNPGNRKEFVRRNGPYALYMTVSAGAKLPCSAPGFLDSGLTVFASTLPRPARRGHVAPERDFDSGISPASTARCTFA